MTAIAARKSAPGSVMRLSTFSMYCSSPCRSHAWDEAAVLTQVVRQYRSVEHERRVKYVKKTIRTAYSVMCSQPCESAAASCCSQATSVKNLAMVVGKSRIGRRRR